MIRLLTITDATLRRLIAKAEDDVLRLEESVPTMTRDGIRNIAARRTVEMVLEELGIGVVSDPED